MGEITVGYEGMNRGTYQQVQQVLYIR